MKCLSFYFADKIEALMKLKSMTNIKEVRYFLGLTGYYWKFICNYLDIMHSLNCLTHKSQPFIWTPECQSSFDMLCWQLANTSVVQLPDPDKPYLLFTDVSKFYRSGVLNQAFMKDSNEAFMRILTSKDPLKSVECQTHDL